MELKDFITKVISDITGSVKECRESLKGTAIVAPANVSSNNRKIKLSSNNLEVHDIDFEISVATGDSGSQKSGGGVFVASFIKLGANSEESEHTENVSRVKFTIPIAYVSTTKK